MRHAITKRHQGCLRSQCVKKEAAVKERLTPEETEGFSKALDTGPIDFATSRADVKPSSALPGRKLVDIDQLKLDLEMVLVTDDEPPPTLTEVAKRLGYSCSTLYRYFPNVKNGKKETGRCPGGNTTGVPRLGVCGGSPGCQN